jgi:hypothetical protein
LTLEIRGLCCFQSSRKGIAAMASLLLTLAASGVMILAQADDGTIITPLPDLTCQNWNAQKRGADAELMAKVAGVWEADGVIPGTPGVIDATPEHVVVTQWATGELTYEKSACFAPYGFEPACAQSIGHGEWFAYPAEGKWFFYATRLTGSGYNGQMIAPNCGGGFARFTGKNTIVTKTGGTSKRTGAAP